MFYFSLEVVSHEANVCGMNTILNRRNHLLKIKQTDFSQLFATCIQVIISV